LIEQLFQLYFLLSLLQLPVVVGFFQIGSIWIYSFYHSRPYLSPSYTVCFTECD